jgi:acetolactate synthase-1/2/3 large subunit
MNGAELLLRTAVRAGVDICFANAGTTEIPLVIALEKEPAIRPVLGLFEGVCTGAADGYGRMLDRPAMTLLHLGPGFANGIANLHNARRARTPILNVIGEHSTWHRPADPPLAMNIEPLVSAVSGWYRTNTSAEHLSRDITDALSAALEGQIASLIVPNDYQWAGTATTAISEPVVSCDPVDPATIEKAGGLLRTHGKTALVLGGRALRRDGLAQAARVKAVTGCDLLTVTFPGYLERGEGLPDVIRIPYFPEPAQELISQYDALLLAGVAEPVTFFGYEGIDSYVFPRHLKRVSIGIGRQQVVEALVLLADMLDAPRLPHLPAEVLAKRQIPPLPQGRLDAEKVCRTLAALQPEGAIIVDEGITASLPYYPLTAGVAPHSLLTIAGGSIGYGMPCALGAALACPDRPVINLQADGSAMYTVQALWTQAREGADVTTLICANRSYNIIDVELSRAGMTGAGGAAQSLVRLSPPDIKWVKIAEGMGVPAVSVETVEDLAGRFKEALAEPGPHLIEMVL